MHISDHGTSQVGEELCGMLGCEERETNSSYAMAGYDGLAGYDSQDGYARMLEDYEYLEIYDVSFNLSRCCLY